MPHTENRKDERVRYSCSECADYELEKAFSGCAGTEAEEEYGQIDPPDECPACGASIEKQTLTN